MRGAADGQLTRVRRCRCWLGVARRRSLLRTIGALLLFAIVPVAITIPALAALALVRGVCSLVVAYDAIRYRESRVRVRHSDLVAERDPRCLARQGAGPFRPQNLSPRGAARRSFCHESA